MNYLHTIFGILLLAVAMTGITACSSDDDDTNFSTPQYESVSAYYEVTSHNSDIKSVELTSSGNYIVIRDNASSRQAYFFSRFVIAPDEDETRATTYQNIIKGRFTKISDTEFELEGFGRIVITGNADNAMSLEITPEDGQTYTLTAAKKTQNPDSQKTSWLCRTWDISGFAMKIEMTKGGNTVTVIDGKYSMDDEQRLKQDIVAGLKTLFQTFFPEEYERDREGADATAENAVKDINITGENSPLQIIFTKAGTYMVLYKGEKLAVATWAWDDEEKGILRYSWDYSNMGKDKGSWSTKYGTAEVSFSSHQLVLKEEGNSDVLSEYVGDFSVYKSISWLLEEEQ